MFELTAWQFLVAFFMSLGAVCIFIWAVLSGQCNNIEDIKHQVLQAEDDGGHGYEQSG